MSRRVPDRLVPAAILAALLASAALAGGDTRAAHPPLGPLVPVRVTAIAQASKWPSTSVRDVALTGGGGADAVTVTMGADGYGGLTVTAGRRVLLRASHVSGAGVLYFAHHLPVLVTASDRWGCGSGGCAYTGYTYVPGARRLEPLGGAAGLLAPEYALRDGRFVGAGPALTAFFGFVSLGARGLVLGERLYDATGHLAIQDYAVVAEPGGAGSWQPVGPAMYTPDRSLPARYAGSQSALGVATQFLVGVCLGLPVETASTTAGPGAAAARLYARARRALTPCAYPNVQALGTTMLHGSATAIRLAVYAQSAPGDDLESDTATLRFAPGSALRVDAVVAHARSLRYRSPARVLALLAASEGVRAYLAAHPGILVEEPWASGPGTWTVAFALASGAFAQATVNAQTGAIRLPAAAAARA